jgi:hypothetical protein
MDPIWLLIFSWTGFDEKRGFDGYLLISHLRPGNSGWGYATL